MQVGVILSGAEWIKPPTLRIQAGSRCINGTRTNVNERKRVLGVFVRHNLFGHLDVPRILVSCGDQTVGSRPPCSALFCCKD